jgi:hypothetical protein
VPRVAVLFFRRFAQYFDMRSPTALRWAAVIFAAPWPFAADAVCGRPIGCISDGTTAHPQFGKCAQERTNFSLQGVQPCLGSNKGVATDF